ncbi:hypothetical protein C1I97_06520 [Streptomyces sp. NTH33]|uniref:phosphotransferase family protein n=1 Tax=Streptomyces sp. NTH33 TaxID=1735453 RepID=UPI000DA84CA8|nr:phosphotransferase [Streptomyces sp. NTH33]PZH16436.1 hypothetical protein C1I97_06520 [Streptomyces sp. NTH33]
MNGITIPPANQLLRLPGAVIKIYREPWRAHTERTALQQLAKAGIPAPPILGADSLGTRPFLVLGHLPGTTADRTEAAVRRALTYLHTVHQLTGPAYGRLNAPTAGSWSGYLHQRLRSYRDALCHHQLPAVARTAQRVMDRALPEPTAPCLLHNDPEPTNFLLADDAIIGIDWELAIYGDPDLDHARAGHAFRVRPTRLREILTDLAIPHSIDALHTYSTVHILGRLMSAVTANPPDRAAAQLYLNALTTQSIP